MSAVTWAVGALGVEVSGPEIVLAALREQWSAQLRPVEPGWRVRFDWQPLASALHLPTVPRLRWFGDSLAGWDEADCRARFDLSAARTEVVIHAEVEYWVDYVLRVVTAMLAFRRGGMLFHGAGLEVQGQGMVLFGPSGIGKTTAARHARGRVLNDDLVLLCPTETGWQVAATPFTHPGQVPPGEGTLPLRALCRLVQSPRVRLQALDGASALAEVLAGIPLLPAHPPLAKTLLRRGMALLRQVPLYTLELRADDAYWDVLLDLV